MVINELTEACSNDDNGMTNEVTVTNGSLTELVNYIIDKHHSYLRRELPQLADLTEKIMKVHSARHEE